MKNLSPRKKQIAIGLGAVAIVIILLGFVKFLQIRSIIAANAGRGAPPQAVTSALVSAEEWPILFEAVGSLRPVQGAMLSAEESGRVAKLGFDSGSTVSAGDLLVALDTSVEESELAGARAKLHLAELTAKRQRALRERNATAQASVDSAESERQSLAAGVERLQSVIRRKTILAPFDGIAGIRSVNVGQTLNVGDPVISLNAYDKMFVDFSLPQKAVGNVPVGSSVLIRVDAYPGQKFAGSLTSIESAVNTSTRNIGFQATLDNADRKLVPGMFVNISIELPKKEKLLVIPGTSIQYAPYGDSVYRIGKAVGPESPLRSAEAVIVKVGRSYGDRVAILSGLKEGEEVVSSGTFKMHPGVQVMVNNSVQPKNELSPTVDNS